MIRLQGVSKSFNGQYAVQDLSLDIGSGEFCCLIGPSGCGKTTTLKMINRMIEPSHGEIAIGGQSASALKPHELRRRIGYVIQSIGLFPHMSVLENICVVPRLLKWDQDQAKKRARELLDLFGLDPDLFSRKRPAELSGGQAQRIGVARALAADPEILLMDEPFGAVDPIVRANLQQQFISIQKELQKTIVFVTHDVDEAVRLGSRIALLKEGELLQVDAPGEILARPRDGFVRDFMGADRALKRMSKIVISQVYRRAQAVLAPASDGELQPVPAEAGQGGEQRMVWLVSSEGRLLGGQKSPAPRRSEEVAPWPTEGVLAPETDLRSALARFMEQRTDCLPVVDEAHRLLGEVSLEQLLEA
jgi:osmoprotectant transport system ATP-binding protein